MRKLEGGRRGDDNGELKYGQERGEDRRKQEKNQGDKIK